MAKTILVIDDSKSSRLAAKLVLQKARFNVIEAEDGQAALALLDGREVNLAICDVNMPVMDGIEFVKAVKAMRLYKFLPILMLTTESQEAAKLKGKDAGATAWMVKPMNYAAPEGRGIKETGTIRLASASPEGRTPQRGGEYTRPDLSQNS